MHSIEDAIANLRAAQRRRGSAISIERTLIVLVLGVGLITSLQFAHVTGATQYLRLNSAHANAASPSPADKFVEAKIAEH